LQSSHSVLIPEILAFLEACDIETVRCTSHANAEDLTRVDALKALHRYGLGITSDSKQHLHETIPRIASHCSTLNAAYNDARRKLFGGDMGKALHDTDKFGRTPLHHSVRRDNHEASVVLIRLGASIDSGNISSRWSPLMLAAWVGNHRAACLLIENGADVDYACGSGWTPIGAAAVAGNIDMIRLLMDYGADLAWAKEELKHLAARQMQEFALESFKTLTLTLDNCLRTRSDSFSSLSSMASESSAFEE
jgi:hypothetical protein